MPLIKVGEMEDKERFLGRNPLRGARRSALRHCRSCVHFSVRSSVPQFNLLLSVLFPSFHSSVSGSSRKEAKGCSDSVWKSGQE